VGPTHRSETPDCYGFDYKRLPHRPPMGTPCFGLAPRTSHLASQFASQRAGPRPRARRATPPGADPLAPTPAPSDAGGSFVQKQCQPLDVRVRVPVNTPRQKRVALKADCGGSPRRVHVVGAAGGRLPDVDDCTGFSEMSGAASNQCVQMKSGSTWRNIMQHARRLPALPPSSGRASLKQ